MGSGRFLAVFSRADGAAKPDPTAYARERLTALVESAADDDAKARCETIIDAEGNGSGIAFEAPDPATRRQRVPKVTTHEGEGARVYCVARSAIKRTAKLGGILQWMGVSNDMTNPDFVPPNDADIIAAHYRRMMARQRWTKANKALSALKAMQNAGKGLFGGASGSAKRPDAASPLAASSPSADFIPARPDSPPDGIVRARLSDASKAPAPARASFEPGVGPARASSEPATGQLPKRSDVRRFLRDIEGSWCFVIVDVKKDLVLAAMSDECEAAGELFAAVAEDGAVVFGDDPATVPDAVAAVNVPPGTYYVGRVAEDVADVDFRRFAKETETKEVAVKEPTDSAA